MTNHNGGDDLNEYLQQLVAEACSYPAKSPERQKKLNEIVRKVTKSGKLWKENTPYYHDALQQTWLLFCRNPEKYRPDSCSVITWLNRSLKWRLKEFEVDQAEWDARTKTGPMPGDEETTDPIDDLPASPDIPLLLEETIDWVQTDSDGKLRNTIFRKRPEINAQALILRRLPPETPWDTIAAEFDLKEKAEIKDLPKVYSRRCLPLLKNFGRQQGYDIEEDKPKEKRDEDKKKRNEYKKKMNEDKKKMNEDKKKMNEDKKKMNEDKKKMNEESFFKKTFDVTSQ